MAAVGYRADAPVLGMRGAPREGRLGLAKVALESVEFAVHGVDSFVRGYYLFHTSMRTLLTLESQQC